MKLNIHKSKTADEISLNNEILTLNGMDYNIGNVEVFEQNEEGILIPPPVWKETEDGQVFIQIGADPSRFSCFGIGIPFKDGEGVEHICQNILLYFDIDGNGVISLDELSKFISVFNMSEEDRRAVMSARWKELTGGKRLSELSDDKRIEVLMRGVSV